MTRAVELAQVASTGVSEAFKNRIINGAMVIDQRNAGASVTPSSSAYTLDRWRIITSPGSKFSFQQSSTVPAGFNNSVICTSTSAYSAASGDVFRFTQFIEGFNVADLGWGTANAQTVTLSFWVRSSLTGTFAVAINNENADRSYVATYTISSANTFEYKTITITGDTTGTWVKTTGAGMGINFDLGSGSSSNTTANAWQAGNFSRTSGSVSVVGTNGATFYITGVQLEVGSTATSFDYRPYGTELALCQRYCFTIRGNSNYSNGFSRYLGLGSGTNQFLFMPQYPVMMRTPPTLITSDFTAGNLDLYNYATAGALTFSSVSLSEGDVVHGQVTLFTTSGVSTGQNCSWRWNGNPNAYIGFSAEL